MKKIIFSIILCSFCITSYAQIPTDIKAALQSKTWKFEDSEENLSFKFDDCNYSIYWENEQIGGEAEYYLSNTSCVNESFDSSLVCQSTNGNYLIIGDSCYQLEFLSENKFRMKVIGTEMPKVGKRWTTYIGH